MARYGRDYGRDFGGREQGRWWHQGPPLSGGMRSDGGGGNQDWRNYAGEEGWLGGGREGSPYDEGYYGLEREPRRGGWGGGPAGRYGVDYTDRSDQGDFRSGRGYGGRSAGPNEWGRHSGYTDGWDDQAGPGRSGGGLFGQAYDRGVRVRAAQIMTENPRAVTGDASISEVAGMMRDLDVGIVPVVDNDQNRRLRGVITDRDIAIRAVAEGRDGTSTVSECMTERVRAVNKHDSVQDVMRVMRQEQVRRVPVTDREGRLVGIIAQADLAVDYGSADPERESEVSEVLERVSEPARPSPDRFVAGGRAAKQQPGDSEERGARD